MFVANRVIVYGILKARKLNSTEFSKNEKSRGKKTKKFGEVENSGEETRINEPTVGSQALYTLRNRVDTILGQWNTKGGGILLSGIWLRLSLIL